jgi:3-oxoadipate enol-lactonase
MDSVREAVIERWFAPGFAASSPDWFRAANGAFSSTSADGYIACCAALAASDLAEAVGEIRVPTLIIGGRHDAATPPAEATWLHESIAASELTIFDGAAHLSNLDVPDAFTARLLAFLASID